MPRTFALQAKLDFTHVFDVDSAVGQNCPNRPDDVRLVQYLLAVWMAHEKNTQKLLAHTRDVPPMVVDGSFGHDSLAALRAFEAFHAPAVKADARVDPIFGSPHSTKLFLMNQILFLAGGLAGGIPRTRIDFPRQLLTHLFR